MSSPVYFSFKRFVRLDKRKNDPLYLQIVYQFINAVQRKLILPGTKIPGSRVISKELKVHRKTVIAAMEELQAQDWIDVVPSVGTFVKDSQVKKATNSIASAAQEHNFSSFNYSPLFSFNTSFEQGDKRFNINDGKADYRLLDTKELARFYSNSLKKKKLLQEFVNREIRGSNFFKEQLSFYLNINRSFHISKDNIAVSGSKEMLLYVLTQIIIKRGDIVLVGDYSYYYSNLIFNQVGAKIKTVPIDKEGLQVDFIKTSFKKGEIRCVYLNTKNQYPSTVELSADRRKKLLELSLEYDFIIVEDDIDYEIQYEASISAPLMSENNGKIIYLGSFGRFLLPPFQRNFVISSESLIKEMNAYLQVIDSQSDAIMENALGEMIKEGDVYRLQRKNSTIYRDRKLHFSQTLRAFFENKIDFQEPKSGFAFWLNFKQEISLISMAKRAAEKDLFIPRNCIYQDKRVAAMRLGFASFTKEEINTIVSILYESHESVCQVTTNSIDT